MITGFHHFSIACSDCDRSIAFYRDLLGFEPVSDRTIEPGGFVEHVTGVPSAHVRIVHLQRDGFNFELLEYKSPRGAQRAVAPNNVGAAHVCLITDDIEGDCDRFHAAGLTVRSTGGRPAVVRGGPNDGGKCLYAEDPDGNCVELVQLVRPWPKGDA